MKTNIYIDGYNFYYGLLKNSEYKWLDLVSLFQRLVTEQNPQALVHHLHFFTAPCLGRFSQHGNASQQAQDAYQRALTALYPNVNIHNGFHSVEKANLPKATDGSKVVDLNQKSLVWKLEEKQSDVNIALQLLLDALDRDAEQLIVCSNDTDLEPALRLIKQRSPSTKIGIIIPSRKGNARPANHRLSQYADWTRNHVLDNELAGAQLPDKIPTPKKPIFKPRHW